MFFRSQLKSSKKSLFTLVSIFTAALLLLSACSPRAESTTEAPAAQPTSAPTTASTSGLPPTGSGLLAVANNPEFGDILTDAEGMTLYIWTKDTTPGMSACNGDCAANWPPLTVASGASLPTASEISAELGTITRDDGSTQLTINGMPLYYFAGDAAPGDVNGQGLGESWYVVDPSGQMITSSMSAASTPMATEAMDDMGEDDYSMSTPQATSGVPGTGEDVDTNVEAAAQQVISGTVTVAVVAYDEPGWMVIHADNNGAPGPVIGLARVTPGLTEDLVVPIDVSQATDTLYAMLHKDEGVVGLYEFPGEDTPVSKGDTMFSPAFALEGDLPAENTPAVVVADSPASEGSVTVPLVISAGQGWMVIHADDNGAPGPVLGQSAVSDGLNVNVAVELSQDAAPGTRLHAMLHTDAGVAGTYEFPGDDTPVRVGDQVVMLPFQVIDAMSSMDGSGDMGASVSIMDGSFSGDPLTISAGTTVVWTNEGSNPHTVTADDGSFDSGNLSNGDTFSFTFTTPGEYPYYCAYHGGPGGSGMSGTIIVTP